MRIIGGKNKGKKIILPVDKNTRPLRDMVKESIFNLIEHSNKFNISISNSVVLDLFSGSGSFGLECLSRGAKFITFVENYVHALGILKKNISMMNAMPFSEIIENNCFECLKQNSIVKRKCLKSRKCEKTFKECVAKCEDKRKKGECKIYELFN